MIENYWWFVSGLTGTTLFLVTYLWGRRTEGSPTTVTVGTNSTNADCETACSDFELRRNERCRAKFAEAEAKTKMEARDREFIEAAAAVGVATAAATGAAFAPLGWPGNLILGLVLWTLVTALVAVMTFCLGKKLVASEAWTAASRILTDANNAVLDARTVIRDKCPAERADAVLNSPDPC